MDRVQLPDRNHDSTIIGIAKTLIGNGIRLFSRDKGNNIP